MMAVAKMAAADDSGGGRQWQRWWTKAADNNRTQDWVVDYDGEGQEQAGNNIGIRRQTEKTMLFLAGVIHFLL
jgi:hypothetical protein